MFNTYSLLFTKNYVSILKPILLQQGAWIEFPGCESSLVTIKEQMEKWNNSNL